MKKMTEINDFEEFDITILNTNHMRKIQKIASEICYYYGNLARLYAYAAGIKKIQKGNIFYSQTIEDNKNLLFTVRDLKIQIEELEKKFSFLIKP
jgi:hypothetical protein